MSTTNDRTLTESAGAAVPTKVDIADFSAKVKEQISAMSPRERSAAMPVMASFDESARVELWRAAFEAGWNAAFNRVESVLEAEGLALKYSRLCKGALS